MHILQEFRLTNVGGCALVAGGLSAESIQLASVSWGYLTAKAKHFPGASRDK